MCRSVLVSSCRQAITGTLIIFRNDTTKLLGPVDQSIQLGDGGTGLTTDFNAFYRINKTVSLYTNGLYLINPREHNGVSTAGGSVPGATAIAYGSDVISVPDQFMYWLGANLSAGDFFVSEACVSKVFLLVT